MRCPSDNTATIDQSSFWTPGAWHWDAHRIGWTVAGVFTLLTILISGLSILAHCRNYNMPRQQRQIIRILFMPAVYAFISFLSYRFFREYVYFSLVESVYEAITLSAFLLLLIEYVAESAEKYDRSSLLAEKEKRRLVIPLCCWRYRPTKEYFMHAVKWSVLQYVFVRPTITLISIICEAAGVLCGSQSYNVHFASVYLDTIDFISISVALYGLILFYDLTKEDLRGRRPLAKFLAIKLLVFFTFYQTFIFDALEGRVIHATAYWTETNIANGLNALAICIEMLLFGAFMWWAYPVGEYKRESTPATTIGTPLLECFNYSDFLSEGKLSIRYFMSKGRRTSSSKTATPSAPPPEYTQDGEPAYDLQWKPYLSGHSNFVVSDAPPTEYESDVPLPAYLQEQRASAADGTAVM